MMIRCRSIVMRATAFTNGRLSTRAQLSSRRQLQPQPDGDVVDYDVENPPDQERSRLSTNKRNQGLAEVIRGGLLQLNQTAWEIQNAPITRKSMFSQKDKNGRKESNMDAHSLSEAHRIQRVATECLQLMAEKQEGGLTVQSDPIMILNVEMKGNQLAVLYWSLPLDILLDEDLSVQEKQILEFRMHQSIETGNGRSILQRRVHAVLRHYYPPKLRLQPATDEQIYNLIKDFVDLY